MKALSQLGHAMEFLKDRTATASRSSRSAHPERCSKPPASSPRCRPATTIPASCAPRTATPRRRRGVRRGDREAPSLRARDRAAARLAHGRTRARVMFDVVIVGGGPAGLSADSGPGSLPASRSGVRRGPAAETRASLAVHNFLTREGIGTGRDAAPRARAATPVRTSSCERSAWRARAVSGGAFRLRLFGSPARWEHAEAAARDRHSGTTASILPGAPPASSGRGVYYCAFL